MVGIEITLFKPLYNSSANVCKHTLLVHNFAIGKGVR